MMQMMMRPADDCSHCHENVVLSGGEVMMRSALEVKIRVQKEGEIFKPPRVLVWRARASPVKDEILNS